MTIPEFLKLGYTRWLEIHWRIAGTDEQVEAIMLQEGISGDFYRMCYSNIAPKNSDGFFSYWIALKDNNENNTRFSNQYKI